MSNPHQTDPPSGPNWRTSSSSAWLGRSIAELTGQDLVKAVTASIRDTPHQLAEIFGTTSAPTPLQLPQRAIPLPLTNKFLEPGNKPDRQRLEIVTAQIYLQHLLRALLMATLSL
ncbi:hypothetical protein PTTG_25951 [Puccinia triticina 1-1 BBBD Race 1]|uniref:Uncharacterized protein n=1 Tax=Puccinia triticina (isolate 1-1 / race 1 (BBBD)) TaxID=630390 RepID=A0A180H0B4_PUCT1|nr:hypothetical protein PTTG_25951 [Puccinia triticina 1-1 BBBD Race 1]